mmetsp:Transcript_39991/g.82295  ORF Transcript_39991/g.82295 Transcript_39991/m.82295 type:complete len:629 (-) Transcript_39991:401-2287(-)
MTTAVVATSSSALRDYDQQRAEIAINSEQNQDIIEDEEIESIEAEEDAAMAQEEEQLMREGLLVKEDNASDRKAVERDMLTTALVNSVVQTRGAAASERIQFSTGVANPLAAKQELPSPKSASGTTAAAPATSTSTSTPTRRSRRKSAVGSPDGTSRDDKSRSPVMTRRRTGRPPTLSSKAKAASAIDEHEPQTPRSQKRNSKRSGSKSARADGKKIASPGGGRQGVSPQPLPAKPSVPNVMAAAASLMAAPQQPHHQQTMPPPPVMTMQLPSNPSSVAPSPLLSGAAGSNGRARIFSIDLDAAGIDFGVGSSDGTAPTSRKSTLGDDSATNAPGRLRGMSFELFSFGIGADEPLPPPATVQVTSSSAAITTSTATAGGRPRGDSIIFDPVSFCDGGIHETNALTKIGSRRASVDEVDIMNSPGFVEAPANSVISNHPGAPAAASAASAAVSSGRKHSLEAVLIPDHSPLTVSSSSKRKLTAVSSIKVNSASSAARLKGLTPAAVKYTTTSSSPVPPFSGQTISMPHGSAAAAAAAMSLPASFLPQTTLPSSLNGTAIANTACPMELLNKGGRIGIYLPEARRARILKFHSKRKNRIWRKRIKYDCRKKLADSRPRIKGRFVKRSEDE